MLRFIFIFMLAAISSTYSVAKTLPEDHKSAVILTYHRIGQELYPETNLQAERFKEHLDTILSEGYNVISLPELIQSLKHKIALPTRTIVITFEGAYRSSYDSAMKDLIANNIPFTVLYAADHAQSKSTQYLNWSELKKLAREDHVDLGVLPASYTHFSGMMTEDAQRLINKAKAQHREHFKKEAKIFSYPFGEYSKEIYENVKKSGFDTALSAHSGVANPSADLFALPRFHLTERYGDLQRFRMITQALPLPVENIEPAYPNHDAPITQIGFSIPSDLNTQNLSCFISDQGRIPVEIIDQRVEIRPPSPIDGERTRLNCTIPEQGENGHIRWRWYGLLFTQNRQNQAQPELLEFQE